MIDPRRLQVLQAVAAAGSIVGAANALRLSPPAVSQQVRILEREAGAQLLDRSGRQIALTAAGRMLARHADRISTQLREAERELAELTGQVAGPVRLAAFQSIMTTLVVPALRRLAHTHQAIQPTVLERYPPHATAELRRGELDIVLTEYDADPPQPRDLAMRPLFHDPYRLVVPREWGVTPTTLAELASRTWVAGPPDTACDHALRRLTAEAGLELSIVDVCVEFPSVLALVAAGRGAAIVPQSTVAIAPAQVAVCTRPHIGGRRIGALYRTSRGYPSPATNAVLAALVETGEGL